MQAMVEAKQEPGAMRPENETEQPGPLRTGLSTGTCATAGALAAARLALADECLTTVTVVLPRGQPVRLPIEAVRRVTGGAGAAVIKDAGDDPDATHGARVWCCVVPTAAPGITFHAGCGVGIVTRSGLPVAVGEPAINPVPRRMISEHLQAIADELGHTGGFQVTVSVEGGEEIARRTMNPRLGIEGGISILGTTGIVRPFSCAAYIASIHQGIDVARSNGIRHVACCTGGTSEAFARAHLGLDDMALVEMGDFFGAVLKYLRHNPLPRISLVAGFGKLSKFAAGHPDTHSRKCGIDFGFLAREARAAGAGEALCDWIGASNTSLQALEACRAEGIALGERICCRALERARQRLGEVGELAVYAVDRSGAEIGRAGEGAA